MKINVQKTALKSVKDHTVIIPVYQQGSQVILPDGGNHLKLLVEQLKKEKAFEGKLKQVCYLRCVKAGQSQNVLFMGLGKKTELKLNQLREVLIKASARLGKEKVPSFTFHLGSVVVDCDCPEYLAQAVAESLILPLYQFSKFKKDATQNSGVKAVTLAVDSAEALKTGNKGVAKARTMIDACNLVRDLVNTPSNELRTDHYAAMAADIGKQAGLKVKIMKEDELKKGGFNALLAVNKGSDQPPRMVILEHNADKKGLDTICLVGKGITFDTGGISLKPSNAMEDMKCDMAGSATVLGLMQIVAQLNLPLHVVGIMPITDNMPSGKATVPGDIVKSYQGKTIEILNTDAEGRLILADAMAYADKQYKPKLLMDFATLTGACVIALGEAGAGIMGTDQKTMDELKKLSCKTGDKIWQLPLWDEFRDEFKSDCADIRNIGTTREAGASKGGIFLQAFLNDKTPWVHFDIAGSAFTHHPTHRYYPKGATAACVRLVAEFLSNRR